MDNDELNYWLCLWYHQKILRKCVHEFHVSDEDRDTEGRIMWVCAKCPRKIGRYSNDAPVSSQFSIPDYLSDPAVILGIMKEYKIFAAWNHINNTWMAVAPDHHFGLGKGAKTKYRNDPEYERAVMLALKAKVRKRENG